MSDIKKIIEAETEASENNRDAPITEGAKVTRPNRVARRSIRSGSTPTKSPHSSPSPTQPVSLGRPSPGHGSCNESRRSRQGSATPRPNCAPPSGTSPTCSDTSANRRRSNSNKNGDGMWSPAEGRAMSHLGKGGRT